MHATRERWNLSRPLTLNVPGDWLSLAAKILFPCTAGAGHTWHFSHISSWAVYSQDPKRPDARVYRVLE
jgi:hypothetical protein